MATITSTPSISPSSISISGTTSKSATISWICPTIPTGSTISSCILTGIATASMTKGSVSITVNSTTVSSGQTFSINLGTNNTTSSVTVTAKGGNTKASGTVTFSDLLYTVTYTEPVVTYTVTFKDWDGSVLKTQSVESGGSATAPDNPTRDGYSFTGWDKTFNNITSDLIVTAQYELIGNTPSEEKITLYVNYIGADSFDYVYVDNTCMSYSRNKQSDMTQSIKSDDNSYLILLNETLNTFFDCKIYFTISGINNIEKIKSANLIINAIVSIEFDEEVYLDINNERVHIFDTYEGITNINVTNYVTSDTLNFTIGAFLDSSISYHEFINIDSIKLDIEYNNSSTESNLNKIILDSATINKLYIGDTNISKVYLGNTQLF